ncbi:MAG: hypothetical protein JXA37_10890 [Chloroflexia bacterium]|nr:hypothetical protein [Chloroflexia bacterium]
MRSPFVAGLFSPINLLMPLLALAAGLLAAWWLFPLGLLLWVVMAMLVARDPGTKFRHTLRKREPLAHRFQGYFDRIERTQVSIFNAIAQTRPRVRQQLQSVQAATDRLVDEAYRMGQWMTVLENHRRMAQTSSDYKQALAKLEKKIEQAEDPLVRNEYEDSLRALQSRQAKLGSLSSQIDRMEAQLSGLASEMEQTLTEVIRLQALNEDQVAQYIPVLLGVLNEELEQLAQFKEQVGATPTVLWPEIR